MDRTKMPNLRNGVKGGFEPGLTRVRVRHSTTELPRSINKINIIIGKATIYLKSTFSLNAPRHNTRSGPLSPSIPSVKSFGLSSFNYTGAVAWNDLPGDIKYVRTKPMFKSKVKQFLFNKCLEQEENPFIVP